MSTSTGRPEDPKQSLLTALVFDWLAERTAAPVEGIAGEPGQFRAAVNGSPLVLAIEPAGTLDLPAAWQARLAAFAARLLPGVGGVLVWLPPGAAPPEQEPNASAVITALQRTLDALAPGANADVGLPISMTIRKREEAGAYVTAFGGLAPLWAQFTDRVSGYFQIDSTALHRLPDDEAYVKALIDRLVEASKALAVGQAASVPAEDTWRVQRLHRGAGLAVLGLPPGDESESGTPLRRRLRTILREAQGRLATGDRAALRLLALYAHYGAAEGDPVGPALRGLDPLSFGGLDVIALVTNGAVKPLMDITRRQELQPPPLQE